MACPGEVIRVLHSANDIRRALSAPVSGGAVHGAEALRARAHLTELHRLPGATMRDAAAKERCFAAALAAAREQSARLWELRAALALVRLHVARQRAGDASAVLERTLSGFGAREQGAELAEARALAAALPPAVTTGGRRGAAGRP